MCNAPYATEIIVHSNLKDGYSRTISTDLEDFIIMLS